MIDYIKYSLKSVQSKFRSQKYTFELFGYDFIMDEKLNTYLIEVNTNPCLEESNQLLKKLLPRMLDDMLNLMVDPLFNYFHLYKDQLKTQQTDPRTDYVISAQN